MASKETGADHVDIRGDVRPFPNRPADESVYCYPHKYRIDLRQTHRGWEQRHTWIWNDGREEVEAWIPGVAPRERESVRDLCDPAYTPRSSSSKLP